MLICMFMLNWVFSIIFLFLNHPLSMGGILLIQTILISLASGFLYYNFWFSYILFLIMIGGMLVMFIYMTSVASNEKFKMPKLMSYFMYFMFMIIFIMSMNFDNFFSSMMNTSLISMNQSMNIINFTLSKYYMYPNMKILIILMIYLFFSLIAVVKIIGKNTGTLRQKY